MAINAEKLVNYAAHGISQVQIAQALGITESRVSQILADSRVQEAVEKRKQALAEESVTEVADLRKISSRLIARMSDLADGTESLSEAVNALEKIDKITSQKLGKESQDTGVRNILIQVPVFVQQSLHTVSRDALNRIDSINGRNMAQMPTSQVLKLLKSNEQANPKNSSKSYSATREGARQAEAAAEN